MQIESVTAHAFGPLGGERLELASGMTVVTGDNESAKSTWHAAIYAALCGRARRAGRPTRDDQAFIDLHKPWDGDAWEVSMVLRLDDGRRVEIRQDLATRVATLTDLAMGRDVPAGDITRDGCPDGSVWLGLDRRSFLATACISQAEVLAVRDEPGHLQTVLQRAAATAGADATAAEALSAIDRFRRENVGPDDARSNRPLRRASVAERKARGQLDTARAAHAQYTQLLERVDRLRRNAAAASLELRLHEAAAARELASDTAARAERARALGAELGRDRPATAADDAAAERVAQALEAWRRRPTLAPLDGPTSAELKQRIDALPAVPAGDTEVALAVEEAWDRFDGLRRSHDAHMGQEPPTPPSGLPEAAPDELVALAQLLEQVPVSVVQAERELARATDELGRLRDAHRRSTAIIAVGVAVAVLGAALGAVGPKVLAALALVGFVLVGVGTSRRRTKAVEAASGERDRIAVHVEAARHQAGDVEEGRRRASERCATLELPADPQALRSVASHIARRDTYHDQHRQWEERGGKLTADVSSAAHALADALVARGADVDGDPVEALAAYRRSCAERARITSEASQRRILEMQLERRVNEESAAVVRAAEAGDVEAALRDVAALVALQTTGPAEEVAARLQDWQVERRRRMQELDVIQRRWSELDQLIGDCSVEELLAAATAAQAHASALAEGLDGARIDALAASEPAGAVVRLRQEAQAASEAAALATGELSSLEQAVPEVAAAEEAVGDAVEALAWLRSLDQTLDITRRFLADAQERTQRDLAPVLTQTLKQWLPTVTGDRYHDAIVDLDTLEVQVCGPSRRWRKAALLSHGTAEQIYLLLRAALVQHLTVGHERCPLLLDDVTVQSDATRTVALLDLLHRLSEDRQVVLFAQERLVGDWAERALGSDRDQLLRLPVVSAS